MEAYKQFKPNLIPNSDVSDPIDIKSIVGDNVQDYIISFKKDGCRLELINGEILTRALKPVTSLWIKDRFQKLADKCKEEGVILEGEFYAHGYRFNEIVRYFKTEDVRDSKNISKLLKMEQKGELEKDWPGRSVAWLSTYHEDLKLHPFDLYIVNLPELSYKERLSWFFSHVLEENGIFYEFRDIIEIKNWFNISTNNILKVIPTWEYVEKLYEEALEDGYEGLVIANSKRTYKFGRSTEKDNHLFKMKEDKNEYDGEVLDILEGTVVKEGVAKTTNELGRSVTSKLQEDREPSGIAKGILTTYNGHELTVSFEGYSHDELREILENKKDYIGKWFKYTGMNPTKNVPRHSHCSRNPWRDSKYLTTKVKIGVRGPAHS